MRRFIPLNTRDDAEWAFPGLSILREREMRAFDKVRRGM